MIEFIVSPLKVLFTNFTGVIVDVNQNRWYLYFNLVGFKNIHLSLKLSLYSDPSEGHTVLTRFFSTDRNGCTNQHKIWHECRCVWPTLRHFLFSWWSAVHRAHSTQNNECIQMTSEFWCFAYMQGSYIISLWSIYLCKKNGIKKMFAMWMCTVCHLLYGLVLWPYFW